MSHRKNGLRALGLTIVAALGLMAFMAAGAQAHWLILEEGKAVVLAGHNEAVTVGKHTEDGTLLIAGVNLEILCQKIEGIDVLIEPGTATTAPASGKVAFNECKGIEKSTKKVVGNCAPINQPIEAAGKALVILHTNAQNYVLFEPESGKPFTTIKFSELCALTETTNVTGELVAECGELSAGAFVQEDCNKHQVTHLLRQASETLFPSQLKYGTHVATVDGIATAALASGKSWSGEV
jgi:hypothetical protein